MALAIPSKTTTTDAILRSGPRRLGLTSVYAGTSMLVLRATFDPTSVTQVSLGVLPQDAIVADVVSYGGATGGASPTVDIGTSGDPDGLANELRSDVVRSAMAENVMGALVDGDEISATTDTEIFGQVGASAPTGGTVTVAVYYWRKDPKAGENLGTGS